MIYEDRPCPLCSRSNLDVFFEHSCVARNRTRAFNWRVSNVVCRDCGFVFVSPAPIEDALREYYADTLPLYGDGHFDVERRLALIRRHAADQAKCGVFVDLGGNNAPAFHDGVRSFFNEFIVVDYNSQIGAGYESIFEVPSGYASVIGAYYILEHVRDIDGFVGGIADALKAGGLLIAEVPDLHLYSTEKSVLEFHEHLNHFSVATLCVFCARHGLKLVEISRSEASREFGFAAVFQKTGVPERDSAPGFWERHEASAHLEIGLDIARARRERMSERRDEIRRRLEAGEGVVVWAANRIAEDLLSGLPPKRRLLVVDGDPNKRGSFVGHEVSSPGDRVSEIAAAERIIVCTSGHADAILSWIRDRTMTGRVAKKITVIDDNNRGIDRMI